VSLDDFVRDAAPLRLQKLEWALNRRPDCQICGSKREAETSAGYCQTHLARVNQLQDKGISISDWSNSQHPLPPLAVCSVPDCVHDGAVPAHLDGCLPKRLCRNHHWHWNRWKKDGSAADERGWNQWLTSPQVTNSVTPENRRGELRLAHLPLRLQQEIRYALHRHGSTARRTQWRPLEIQKVVDAIADAGLMTLSDPAMVTVIRPASVWEARVWEGLPIAARALSANPASAKRDGWFDPSVVGASPFSGTQGQQNRRKVWLLTLVSQRWLRDVLWDHLRDEAIKPAGRRLSATRVYTRIKGIAMLSLILRQSRADHGEDPEALNQRDAAIVKDTWDLWYREKLPISTSSDATSPIVLNERTRHTYMSSVRAVLHSYRARDALPPGLELFILNLPEYAAKASAPRPRPLSFGDFQKLVSEENLRRLEDVDTDDVGLVDVWLTQAFQGGRVGETISLRLGCVGIIGAAQPYLWRDITKIDVLDFGVPCHIPVYQRLLRRQQLTRSRLRIRYADDLAQLDETGRATLEAHWDRTMPLFPSLKKNPDLTVSMSYSWFRFAWNEWFTELGLSRITTHQTRATLATSLLNNGAPPALVRQVLGHFSDDALAHYARYNDDTVTRHLQKVWAAGPGTDKPGTILLKPTDILTTNNGGPVPIDLSVIPVEHGLCRYGPVVHGNSCPFNKNCTGGRKGACEHFVLTGADLAYWERKRDTAFHFAEGAPSDEARDYILGQWQPWEPVLAGLRHALDDLGLLEAAENLDLRVPAHDYFDPLFSMGWTMQSLNGHEDIPRSSAEEPVCAEQAGELR
jgi:integrase